MSGTLVGSPGVTLPSSAKTRISPLEVVEAILAMLAEREGGNNGESYTTLHSRGMTDVALATARKLGLTEAEIQILQEGGEVHDIGKVLVDGSILNKPGKLTSEEWLIMSQHPEHGHNIIKHIGQFDTDTGVGGIVFYHHERWDGTGYPHGLKGEEIPFFARIAAVADVFDALYADRPYRKGWPLEKVVASLQEGKNTLYWGPAVDAFTSALGEGFEWRGHPISLS